MKTRSSVSADISKNVIWINSTDLNSTIKAVKIHEILVNDFGYTDGSMLEEGNHGKGVSITVCDCGVTVRQMREDYIFCKKQEPHNPTQPHHLSLAKEYLAQIYG
jgi:hypothetical protein